MTFKRGEYMKKKINFQKALDFILLMCYNPNIIKINAFEQEKVGLEKAFRELPVGARQ